MGITARLVGNVLTAPTLKRIKTVKGDQPIVELRVMSASYRKTDDGRYEQIDERTFPVDVTVWNERLHEPILKLIKTGASVTITGDLHVNPWIAENQEAQAGVQINADSVSLNLARVEEVVYRERRRQDTGPEAEAAF